MHHKNDKSTSNARKVWQIDPNHLTGRDVFVLSALIIGVFILMITFGLSTSHETYIKWGGLVLNTCVLFGYFAYDSRLVLQKRSFQVLTAVLLILHSAAWVILLSYVGEWKLLWFGVMAFELPTFCYLRDRPE